ncbi:hypothetical protein [Desulfosediminicola flagellatus]|uniref:hypothetical protein n=1 Tax=Desulfosediminicola flagellatus TaxID=2569541 RepID=UPI0010ABE96B|nr:hypothetical protein [Desulfosediminicola flagellatus]
MGYLATKHQVLKALEENLSNTHPQVMEAKWIADKLNINPKELNQVIRTMNKMGEVECDQECTRLLITHTGLSHLGK